MQGASEVVRTVGVASGNRSDVRAAALSHDDSLLLTTGNGGTKVWNPASGVCVNSLETGYGLCCLFAPGGRFAVLGCKDGKLDVIDLGAAAVAHRVDAHTAQVCPNTACEKFMFECVWALCVLRLSHTASTHGCGPAMNIAWTFHPKNRPQEI